MKRLPKALPFPELITNSFSKLSRDFLVADSGISPTTISANTQDHYQSNTLKHSDFLLQALELAKFYRGFCSPNPSVGALIVNSNGVILGTGKHQKAGLPHAEVDALAKITQKPNNATLYVTLEPCCHWGKTPPCVDAIIESGITQIVYGYEDPNPLMKGQGIKKLQAAGIMCQLLTLPQIRAFYESYAYWHRHKKPFMTAKIAMTLNGKIAQEEGAPLPITGEPLRLFTHHSRKAADAILTTINTIMADNPQLNARLDEALSKPLYLLDSQLKLPLSATIFNTAQSITVFHNKNACQNRKNTLITNGVRCIEIETNAYGLNLKTITQYLGQEGRHDVWIEAGGTVFEALLKQNLLQRALIYIAPKWIQNGMSAFSGDLLFEPNTIEWLQMGKDVFM